MVMVTLPNVIWNHIYVKAEKKDNFFYMYMYIQLTSHKCESCIEFKGQSDRLIVGGQECKRHKIGSTNF